MNPPIFAQAPVLAFSFLTVLPLRTGAIAASAFPRAVAYFPLVGFVIGVAVECLDLVLSLALPASLAAALDLTALAIITGGLHLDGLADTADGLLMRGGQQERLAVMREPRVGAFAIAAIVLLLLIEYAALFALAPAERRLGLIAGATLARWAMAVALWQFPYARASGVGFAFKSGLRGSEVAVATLITAVVVLGLGWRALAAASIGLAFALVLGRAATRTLGGLTGDVYGATGELVFAATLISWAAV